MSQKNTVASFVGIPVILLIGISIAFIVHIKYSNDIKTAQAHYRSESHDKSIVLSDKIANSFLQLYQGLRTMARLPGVQTIDRYAKHFSLDSSVAVQEIYNNLGSNVALSEIYIVPVDIDPDKIDPVTQKPEIPITTYDHLIINRNADDDADKPDPIPEIEIYEYRLERIQMQFLLSEYPTIASISGLQYPATIGQVPVTCDNSRFAPEHPDDRDRAGIVYSVPFYGIHGQLRGSLTGVILTHTFRDLLPSGNYVLRNANDDYNAVPNSPGVWKSSWQSIENSQPNTSLLYSEVLPVAVHDTHGQWILWCGQDDAMFWSRPDVRSAQQFEIVGFGFAGFVTIFLLFALTTWLKSRNLMEQEQARLEATVVERTRELTESSATQDEMIERLYQFAENISASSKKLFASSSGLTSTIRDLGAGTGQIQHAIGQVSDATRMTAGGAQEIARGASSQSSSLAKSAKLINNLVNTIHEVSRDAQDAIESADEAIEAARDGSSAVKETISGMRRISETVDKTAVVISSLGDSSNKIGKIVASIENIAKQTNLLALNAAIEAARAGQSGSGFAVVADEVGKLAGGAAAATKDIETLISSLQDQVASAMSVMDDGTRQATEGAKMAERSGQTLEKIHAAIGIVGSKIYHISHACEVLSEGSMQVTSSIDETVAVVTQNTASTEQLSACAEGVASAVKTVVSATDAQKLAVERVTFAADSALQIAEELEAGVVEFNKIGQSSNDPKKSKSVLRAA